MTSTGEGKEENGGCRTEGKRAKTVALQGDKKRNVSSEATVSGKEKGSGSRRELAKAHQTATETTGSHPPNPAAASPSRTQRGSGVL